MSASSPSRYRSRLFNVVTHYSRRLIDRGERAIRHLKIAAVWGTQILLYPLYLVVQTSVTAKQRLSTQAKAGWTRFKALIQSQPPTQLPGVDTPIQQVLQQVETLTLPESCQWQGLQPINPENSQISIDPNQLSDLSSADQTHLTASRVKIQGVATLLSTRTLVLVSVANEILDILTPEQQQTLAARISWEVATLYRQWRLMQTVKGSGGQYRLSNWAKPSLFLPLRVFWQLMAWVQTSPVAIALNLFGESSLVAVEDSRVFDEQEPIQAIASQLEISQTLAPAWLERLALRETFAAIDDRIAQWESHPRQTSTYIAIALRQRGQTLLQTVKTSFILPTVRVCHSERSDSGVKNLTPYFAERSLPSKVVKGYTLHDQSSVADCEQYITPKHPTDPTQTSTSHPFWLIGLIYAAIDYFFGQDHSHHSHQTEITSVNGTEDRTQQFPNSTPSVTLPGAEFTYTPEPDPWLTWDDLFEHPQPTFTPTSAVPNIMGLTGKVQHNFPQLYPGLSVKKQVIFKNAIGAILRRLGFPQPTGTLTVTDGKLPHTQQQSDPVVLRMPVNPIRWFSSLNRTANLAENANPLTQPQKQSVNSSYLIPLQYSGITALANQSEIGAVVKVLPGTLSEQSQTFSPHPLLFDSSSPLSVLSGLSSPPKQPISYSHNPNIEPAPDWIETEAISTGYVKHPLEQVLEWLDIGMFWLEEVTIKAWRWVRRLMIQNKR